MSYVNYEKIQLALEEYLDRGGKIVETENPYEDSLVKQNIAGNELKTLSSNSDNQSRKDLTKVRNLLDQETNGEGINIVNPDSESQQEEHLKTP